MKRYMINLIELRVFSYVLGLSQQDSQLPAKIIALGTNSIAPAMIPRDLWKNAFVNQTL